ncbi:MAG: KH domain-containing protein [Lactobacillales bacterium]|nr:KH domain-containing protein [Lactobacillales bacterium]
MIKVNKFEAKTEEDALNKAMVELNCERANLFYKSEFIEGKLFKGSKYIVEVIEKSDVKEYINSFFKELATSMNISIETEILYNNESFNITLITSNNSLLIGKEGKNLQALQNILRQSLKVKTGISIKLNLDISNYKVKKLSTLEREIKKIAREVQKTKLDVSLDPMNSYERRHIHNLISEYENLTTESTGEGKERHIVIKYIEK